jgi:hypothetical protein
MVHAHDRPAAVRAGARGSCDSDFFRAAQNTQRRFFTCDDFRWRICMLICVLSRHERCGAARARDVFTAPALRVPND